MNQDELRRRIAFYRDLGIKDLYRRAPSVTTSQPVIEVAEPVKVAASAPPVARSVAAEIQRVEPAASTFVAPPMAAAPLQYTKPAELTPLPQDNPESFPQNISQNMESTLPPLAPADDSFAKIIEDIGDCKRCRLCEKRNKIVFG